MASISDEDRRLARKLQEELAATDERWRAAAERRELRSGTAVVRFRGKRYVCDVAGLTVEGNSFTLHLERGLWEVVGLVEGDVGSGSFQLVTTMSQTWWFDDEDDRCFNFAPDARIQVIRRDDRLELTFIGDAFLTDASTGGSERVECEFEADCGTELTGS